MKRFASIDVGSNSILLHIADYKDGKFIEIFDDAQIASLGKGIDKTKRFSTESMELAFQIFQKYSNHLEEYKVSANNVFMIATEASRAVENSKEFFQKIKQKFNLEVNIVSGEMEARYACLGAISGSESCQDANGLLLDIGGASTEVIQYQLAPFELKKVVSLPVGSVRATDWLKEDCFDEKIKEIFTDFEKYNFSGNEATAIAGTATSLMAMMLNLTSYDNEKVNKQEIDVKNFNEFVEKIKKYSVSELETDYPFLGKRANVIIGGSKVLQAFNKKLKLKKLIISTRGLRHGVLIDKVK